MAPKKNSKIPSKSHVQLVMSSWKKDSHGLYDYQSTEDNYRIQHKYIEQSTNIYRDPITNFNIVQLKNQIKQARQTFKHIATIEIERSENNTVFKFEPSAEMLEQNIGDPTKSFYRVIRESSPDTTTDPGYVLKPGDIVKMGRVQYMVIQMKTNNQTLTIRDTHHFNKTGGIFQATQTNENQINCKVCLCNEQTELDPLISPCLCKGSCEKIHVGCLRQWISSKVKKDIGDIASSYNFTKFQCEICKSPFPRIIRVAGKDIQMMTIYKPNQPYIILESLANRLVETSREQRCLHIIAAKENSPIKIGRGHQCEIRITDISVSRSHAEIVFKDDKFYIKDKRSKFGTLIKFKDTSITLEKDKQLKIQMGRSLYEFEIKNAVEEIDTE